jgi:hypothetical protein
LLPRLDYIPNGKISVIRFIRSNRQMDIFSEKFVVPKELIYSYVKGEIDTKEQILRVYAGDEEMLSFEYKIQL